LSQLELQFTVAPADIDETVLSDELPLDYVQRMAAAKAAAGLANAPAGSVVLGADTTVVAAGQILGKPRDRQDALDMLALLSGRTHEVLSAVSLTDGNRTLSDLSATEVRFGEVTPAAAAAYWDTGEPADKAGAYGIQGLGAVFVQSLSGSYTGVVGLPLFETARLLHSFGLLSDIVFSTTAGDSPAAR
jgi:septum formation protein